MYSLYKLITLLLLYFITIKELYIYIKIIINILIVDYYYSYIKIIIIYYNHTLK